MFYNIYSCKFLCSQTAPGSHDKGQIDERHGIASEPWQILGRSLSPDQKLIIPSKRKLVKPSFLSEFFVPQFWPLSLKLSHTLPPLGEKYQGGNQDTHQAGTKDTEHQTDGTLDSHTLGCGSPFWPSFCCQCKRDKTPMTPMTPMPLFS